MTRTYKFILVLFILIFVVSCSKTEIKKSEKKSDVKTKVNKKDVLNFAIVSFGNVSKINKKYLALKNYLEKQLNVRIQFKFEKQYRSIAEKLKDKYDIAIMGAYSYLEAEALSNAVPIVKAIRNGKDYYRSIFVVRQESNIKQIADLMGKNVAFTDRYSTSGFLYPAYYLIKNGFDLRKDIKYSFVKGHDNVLKTILINSSKKRKDAGCCFEAAPEVFLTKKDRKKIRIITIPLKIPSDPIVVSSRLLKEKKFFVEKLKQALINLKDKQILNKISNNLDGYTIANKSDYEELKKIDEIVKQKIK